MKDPEIIILIIDDEESIRESMKDYLEDMGCKVMTSSEPTLCSVYNHENCTANTRCCDVLLTDQNMPRMSGLEFIRMQSERGCKLPPKYKMIMTGVITNDVRLQAEALGCQIIQKPFSLQSVEPLVLTAKAAKEADELP